MKAEGKRRKAEVGKMVTAAVLLLTSAFFLLTCLGCEPCCPADASEWEAAWSWELASAANEQVAPVPSPTPAPEPAPEPRPCPVREEKTVVEVPVEVEVLKPEGKPQTVAPAKRPPCKCQPGRRQCTCSAKCTCGCQKKAAPAAKAKPASTRTVKQQPASTRKRQAPARRVYRSGGIWRGGGIGAACIGGG